MLYLRLLSTKQAEFKKRAKMIRVLSAAVPKASHNSLLDDKLWRSWKPAGDTYSNYGCLSSASLWPSPLCRVLSKKNKSQRGTNWLATRTDLETERQRTQSATKGPSHGDAQSVVLREFSAGVRQNVEFPCISLHHRHWFDLLTHTHMHTHWKSPVYPLQHVWSSLWEKNGDYF